MTYDFLTNDDFLKIIQKRFNTKDIEVVKTEMHPISDNVEGFMGDHYSLKITYRLGEVEDTENFFVKTKPQKADISKEMAADTNVYRKEIFLYDFLLNEFEKLGYRTDFAPKAYYCKNEETIVMDNLMQKGFQLADRKRLYDMDQCKAGLRSLAYLHANSICYEEIKSKELGRTYILKEENPEIFDEIFFVVDDPEGVGRKFIDTTILCFEEIAKLLPESREWKEKLVKKLNNFNPPKTFWQDLPYRKTITHGDLWSNNMLFEYSGEKAVHCCLVDYQLLRHHHPGYDAALIIYSNTRRDFRKKHLSDLLDYYYDTFETILNDRGFKAENILPKKHFLKVVEALKNVALIQGAATRTFVLLPTEITSDAVNSGGEKLGDLFFEGRPKAVVDAFQKDELYRQIITEDAYDLYEHL